MSSAQPSNQEIIRVWADIGGTFTDCFVLANHQRREIKVLSSGLTRTKVRSYLGDHRFSLESFPGADIPHFWNGASAILSDQKGHMIDLGKINHQNSESIGVENANPSALTDLSGDLTFEIDAKLEAPVLATHLLLGIPLLDPLPELDVRLGTTKGTNALLTRAGAKMALLVTKGFGDLLAIGEQDRPDLFALQIQKTDPLTDYIIEIDERLDATGEILKTINEKQIESDLALAVEQGIDAVAICLLHSHLNPEHEQRIATIAQRCGITDISLSTDVAPLIKYVARTETTTLDAYLNPILSCYLGRVWQQFGGVERCRLQMMTSNGNLVEPGAFQGKDSILSGPAGGVIALGDLAIKTGHSKVVGLDMGGTSTDVSRFEGQVGRRYESKIAGIRVMNPMMDIETVAAGGGSICGISEMGRLTVGPQSAGSEPGPACYGKGGPLTITDVNLLLGRIPTDRFPFPLDVTAAKNKLTQQANKLPPSKTLSVEELADGFFDIAITHMAEAVRTVTTAQGSDVRDMALAGFGGAAGQHLCRIADTLEIKTIIDHPDSGLLSALGIGIAKLGCLAANGIYQIWDGSSKLKIDGPKNAAKRSAGAQLTQDQEADRMIDYRFEIDMRYSGTEAPLTIELEPQDSLAKRFHETHQETFGYCRKDHPIELVAIRCEATASEKSIFHGLSGDQAKHGYRRGGENENHFQKSVLPQEKAPTKLWHGGKWLEAQEWDRSEIHTGQVIFGPALIAGPHSTLVLEPGWTATASAAGIITATKQHPIDLHQSNDEKNKIGELSSNGQGNFHHEELERQGDPCPAADRDDAILLEVISRRWQGIADAMGEVLRRTSVSVNIKERRDYSCAIFNSDGVLVANAPHVPVHLGAMGHTVRHMMDTYPEMYSGDCYLSNDPFSGGSHLPDVTAVTPVFCDQKTGGKPDFFIASRAHHAEIGGISPGSMPPHATCLAEEGVLIQDFPLVRNGIQKRVELHQLLSSGEYPSRCPDENLADIDAQRAAGLFGVKSLQELSEIYTKMRLHSIMDQLLEVSGNTVEHWIRTLPEEPLEFKDCLDDGTAIGVTLRREAGGLTIEFETGPAHPNGFNATPAIVTAAVLYVIRCLAGSELPLCEGALRDINIIIPPGLLDPPHHTDPRQCAAVVAGNVETSQRVTDVLLGALQAAAASQGTMNNFLLGNDHFGYYETIAGGSGATSHGNGADGVHTHMTNTRITDPEILESRLPVRLVQFAIRSGSGGGGAYRGGNGVIREFEFLESLVLSLITSRRTTEPYGMENGLPGAAGQNHLIHRNGKAEMLDFRVSRTVMPGDRLVIETPGGGGWGSS